MADAKASKGSTSAADVGDSASAFSHKVIVWWLPILYCLISSLFYLRTYDSAQVKITVMQMGGLALLVFWLARLLEAGRQAITKDDLVCLLPFIAYLGIGIFSYIHAPYNMASVDFFLRHVFFMVAALIAIYELDSAGTEKMTKILIVAAWIAVGYGFLQFVDMMEVGGKRLFPGGIGKGIDPFIWRGAFGKRVFSTYGNPNFFADFLVITFPIILMRWVRTKQFSLLVLMAMLLIDLIASGTKGAWVGFAMVVFLFGVIAFAYFKDLVAPYRKALLTVVAVGVLGFGGIVAKDLSARVVSINFRLFTWEATWQMIMTQPILGTGVGSFPPVYPAFRRPPIFHIEGKHNTETDHSENEYIEQLFDNGILGFGVFIWIIVSTLVVGFRSLRQLTTVQAARDGTPHPRAYDLIGYMVALMGMLGHNFFDVSMRFVSSGVYLGLLSGMVVNLSRGKALFELHAADASRRAAAGGPEPEGTGPLKVLGDFLIWPARLAAIGGLAYFLLGRDWGKIGQDIARAGGWFPFGGIFGEFALLQGPLGRMAHGGEILQWWLAWIVFAGCAGGLGFLMMRLAHKAENPAVPALILAMILPMNIFWGYFKADVHHNIAIYFSKERQWDKALEHYQIVQRLNPNFVMALYFMGNVFNDRFDMRKVYNPAWADTNDVPRDDYERAMDAYDKVRRLAPNYVQHHHQVGALHVKRAEWAVQNGRKDEASAYLDRAVTRFKLYHAIDPVFPPNYYRMAQVHTIRGENEKAIAAYKAQIEAAECQVAPELINKPYLRNTILSYQGYFNEAGTPYPVHRHHTAEGWANLGNAYFLLNDWVESERAYKRSLGYEANYDMARRNLSVLYSRAQQAGRLKTLPPPAGAPPAGEEIFTGYEVLPPKK